MSRDDLEGQRAGKPGFAEHCVMRCTLDYFLRTVHETSKSFQGDLISGVIFVALIRANTQHLAETTQLEYSMSHGVIPNEVRRPVSVKSISDSLDLPYETVRRRIGRLYAEGYCEHIPRQGFVVPERVLMRPEFVDVLARNHANFQQLLARVQRAGLVTEVASPGRLPA